MQCECQFSFTMKTCVQLPIQLSGSPMYMDEIESYEKVCYASMDFNKSHNPADKKAVAVVKSGHTFGYLPTNLTSIFLTSEWSSTKE